MSYPPLTYTEENYIKAIYHQLLADGKCEVLTNDISESLKTKPASVTDMFRKLADKKLINYVKYQGVSLTEEGHKNALRIIRKHRLWEVFLVSKLHFNWDEVHDVAEELEHINSPLLIKRLDEFLGFPQVDPHGDPIPSETGEIHIPAKIPLHTMQPGQKGTVIAVQDSSPVFLKYLDKMEIGIHSFIELLDKVEYDGSLEIRLDTSKKRIISKEVAQNIFISNA